MPILNLTLSGAPDAQQSAKIAATLSALTADILHKAPELTAIVLRHVDPAHWYIGGQTLAELRQSSFFIDTLITDETNTASEKSAYIAAVFAAMQGLLGDVHAVSYVHVHDARPAAWGYGGLTQQFRAVSRQLLQK